MNKKQIFPLSLILLLMISILTFALPVKGIPGIAMYADPATLTLGPSPPPIGETWTFNVRLQNASDVVTIGFDLSWDTTKVNVTDITIGDALPGGSLLIGYWDSASGYIDEITVGVLGTSYNVVNKTVVTVGCEAMGFTGSTTTVDILDVNVFDKTLANILSGDSPYDFDVEILKPPPTDPVAKFSWTPLFPLEGNPATFNAGTLPNKSTAGFDGNTTRPITEYRWDFDDGNYTVVGVTTIVHVFATAGLYHVNLTVYAPKGMGADPSYNETDTIIKDVMVIAPALGRSIDLYTQDYRYPGYSTSYTGEGGEPLNGTAVDSFAPQDLVILYAKLTYNLEPIANKEVAFEIHGPDNPYYNISIYRQAFTDECGVANISFRIPWPDMYAEEIVFGTWTILAKASVAEETVSDWHTFEVGWILSCSIILHDGTTPTFGFDELDTVYINVTVTNIALTPRNVTITAVIYDELGVPVGSAISFVPDVPPGTTTYTLTITIPEWAYVGFGMVYVNLYTELPWNCGTCYGPECSTLIQISPGPGC